MSNFAANPFALLEDESAELVEVAAPVASKQAKSSAPAKKIPLKEQGQPKAAQSAGKPVLKKTGKAPVKDTPFEEAPEHKVKAAGDSDASKKHGKKRDFDRRSANPKSGGGHEKKETSGKASWGNELEAPQLESAEGAAVAADEEDAAAGEPEPEESYKSLAEYKAEKEAARAAAAAQTEVRKPNEGVDESQWKKLTPLVKDDKIEEFMFAGKAQKEKERKVKEKPVKTVLEIAQTFAPAPRPERTGDKGARGRGDGKPRGASSAGGRGGRGGRGGASASSAPRGGARGGRGGKGVPVNVLDQNAFPSLG